MSLEIAASGPMVDRAIDRAVQQGTVRALLELLASLPEEAGAAGDAMLTRLLQPAELGTMLASEPIDFDSLDRLLPFMSSEGHGLLLDALAVSENRNCWIGYRFPSSISACLSARSTMSAGSCSACFVFLCARSRSGGILGNTLDGTSRVRVRLEAIACSSPCRPNVVRSPNGARRWRPPPCTWVWLGRAKPSAAMRTRWCVPPQIRRLPTSASPPGALPDDPGVLSLPARAWTWPMAARRCWEAELARRTPVLLAALRAGGHVVCRSACRVDARRRERLPDPEIRRAAPRPP
jgi:hypothetical protein